jgi:uncharacterized membrane protein
MMILIKIIVIFILVGTFIFYYKGNSGKISNSQPLFVPKMIGFGIGINPKNPIGLLIWVFIILFIFVILLLEK